MKGKKRNKFLAGFLAFVMVFLMLPVVPFAPVEAASAFADNADVIRLPITIRDANADGIVFQISPASWKGWVTNTLSEDGVPEYTNDAIARIADKIDTLNEINTLRSSNSFDETGLGDALYIAYSGNTAGWDSSSFSAADAVDYLNEAKTAHQAAEWLLSHFFVDGKYDRNATATKEYDPEVYFTQTYKGYESLILKPGTYEGNQCYFYSSNATVNGSALKTMFHYTTGADTNVDEIYNDASGTTSTRGGWYPLNNLGFNEKYQYNLNYHTSTAGSGQFVYHEADDLFFAFTGDDDVYLYINNKLVIDDGGIHGQSTSEVYLEDSVGTGTNVTSQTTGSTNDQTWAQYLGLEEGGIYDFDFFQMERNVTESNFSIYTNINVVDSSAVPQKKVYQNGQELIYGSFVPQNSEVTYGFELTNNGGSNSSPIKNLTFVDINLGVSLNYTTDSSNNITYSLDYNQENKEGTNPVTEITDLEWAVYKNGTDPVYTKVKSEPELINILKTGTVDGTGTGIAVGYTFSIRGFRYNVGAPVADENGKIPATKTIVNTVQTTCVGKANNSNTDRVIQGSATVRVRTWNIQNKTFVMDYAKKFTMSTADVFGTELTELSEPKTFEDENTVNSEKVTTTIKLNSDVGNVTLDKNNGNYGTMVMGKEYSLEYTPTKVLNGIDSFIVKIKLDTTTQIGSAAAVSGSNILNKSVSIVPASNVYYEDDFADIVYETKQNGIPVVDIDASNSDVAYDGDIKETDGNEETANGSIHGWETSLKDDTQFSDGSAHVGTSVTEKDEEGKNKTTTATATFFFTGTGVDVYSYTDMNSGIVTGYLYKYDETKVTDGNDGYVASKFLMVDNLAVSPGKPDGDERNGYYQIPTLSFKDLPYGKYKVMLSVSAGKAVEDIEEGNIVYSSTEKRATYYLDGIRVYNPLGETVTGTAADAYKDTTGVDAEKIKTVYKVVNTLLTTKEAVFVDLSPEGLNATEYTTTDVYKTYGPKNEVYLAAGQSITFAVEGDVNTNKYYIGLKSLKGDSVPVNAGFTAGDAQAVTSIAHSTDLYYKVGPATNGSITIANNSPEGSDAILAVTKLQMVGPAPATLALRTISDVEAVSYATTFASMRTVNYEDTLVEDEPEVEVPETPEAPEVEEPEKPEPPVVENPEPEKPVTVPSYIGTLITLVNKLFNALNKWFASR